MRNKKRKERKNIINYYYACGLLNNEKKEYHLLWTPKKTCTIADWLVFILCYSLINAQNSIYIHSYYCDHYSNKSSVSIISFSQQLIFFSFLHKMATFVLLLLIAVTNAACEQKQILNWILDIFYTFQVCM